MDDKTNNGNGTLSPSIGGSITGDGKPLWANSSVITYQQKQDFTVDVTGVDTLVLNADTGGDTNAYDHADWLTLGLSCKSADVTAPSITVVTDPAEPSGSGWCTRAVDLSASATDDGGAAPTIQVSADGGSNWTAYAPQRLIDGVYNLRFRAGNAAGNFSEPVIKEIKIDSIAPAFSASVEASAHTVTLLGTDTGSGVANVQYRVDGTTEWTTMTGASASITLGTATAAVQYRAVDTAGNTTPVESVTVPAAAGAQASVLITSSGQSSTDWFNQSVMVAVRAPGGKSAQYRVDNGVWRAASKPFTLAASGVHTIDHRLFQDSVVVDGSTGSLTVRIDRTAPVTTMTRTPSGAGTPRNPVSLSFSASDRLSGVSKIEYRLNQGDWVAVGAGAPVVVDTIGDLSSTPSAICRRHHRRLCRDLPHDRRCGKCGAKPQHHRFHQGQHGDKRASVCRQGQGGLAGHLQLVGTRPVRQGHLVLG